MLNYMRGEFYRMLHKKSMYIFFCAFAALYALFFLVRSGKLEAQDILGDAKLVSAFLPAVFGGFFYASFYTDDLNSKNLATLVGYGLEKHKIVLSKFILMALFSTALFGLAPIFMATLFALIGAAPASAAFGAVCASVLAALLSAVAFAALAGIAVYGLQRGTFAMVLYVLLALGFVSSLLSMLLNGAIVQGFFPGIETHIMSAITDRIEQSLASGQLEILALAEYAIYVAAALALSVFAFHKKELEF
jgi:ABC-type transport system involved in multi-copper enzyme maturation permease subunit